MKLKPGLEKKLKPREKPAPKKSSLPKKSPNFIKSHTWIGKRHGYVFKRGKHGQGYYKDRKVKFDDDQVISYSPHESPRETGERIR